MKTTTSNPVFTLHQPDRPEVGTCQSLMKAALCLIVSCMFIPFSAKAEVGSADSPEFPLELGSARSVAAVTTTEFPVDLRNKGGVGSVGSAEFVLNTRSDAVDSLVIEISPPATVIAGKWVGLTVSAHFSGGGGARDVSAAANWFVVGNAPAGTRFDKNQLFPGEVSTPTEIRIAASYRFPSGGRRAQTVALTILPAQYEATAPVR